MANNMHHVVSWVVETLVDTFKPNECKLNLRLTGFKAKEGEIEKKLMQ